MLAAFCLAFTALMCTCPAQALEDEAPGTYGAEEDKEKSFSTGTAFFDDAEFSGGVYFMLRDRRRKELTTGRYKKNLDHITTQASGEINSGFIGDFIGADFGFFGSNDIHQSAGIDHEMNFVPWRDPWHMDWSKTRTDDNVSIYKALIKAKLGSAWVRAGYFQPSGPGVLGVNWSFLPGTYKGMEAGADIGRLSLSAAWVDEYKAPWYTDTYHFRSGYGEEHIPWMWSLGARYSFENSLTLELAYGESKDYLQNAHFKASYDVKTGPGDLNIRYHLYAMGDSDNSGKDSTDNFDGTAWQHYLGFTWLYELWTVRLEGTYTWVDFSKEDQRGYFAYRMTNPTGSSKGAYDVWWDARSDWNHHKETAVYLAFERKLDDVLFFPGVYLGTGAIMGWGGKGYGVSEQFKEWAFTFDLGYIKPDGPLEGAWLKLHYTEYRNGTNQPDWGPYKNAFQDEHDFKLMAGIPFSF